MGVEDGGAWRLNGEPSGGLRKRSNESFVLYPPPSVFMMIPRERKSGWDISSRLLIAKGTKGGGEVPFESFFSSSGIPQEDDCKLSLQHPKGQLLAVTRAAIVTITAMNLVLWETKRNTN